MAYTTSVLIWLSVLPASLIGFLYLGRYKARKRVAKLGLSAPIVNSPGPLGIGFFYSVTRAAVKNASLQFWEESFRRNGCSDKGSYTAETYVLGPKRIIMTADPDNVKHILAADFQSWGKGKNLYEAFKPFLGDGVLSTDGEKWHSARQVMRPLFIRDRVTDLGIFERNCQRLLPLLRSGQPMDIDDLVFRFTLDTVSEFLLGESLATLANADNSFTHAFNVVQETQSVLMRAGPLKPFVSRQKYNAGIRVVESYIEPSIRHAIALTASGKNTFSKNIDDENNTLLHALAAYTQDPKIIRDQLVTVLFAGSDTTASALTWLLFELSRNPNVVAKLQRVISDTLGTTDSTRLPSYEELKSMKYLTNCINETLRYHTTMPMATRQATRDTTLPRGGGPDGQSPIAILKDTTVLYSALLMHRRRDLYPPVSQGFPDPRTWCPERWDAWQPKAWQLIPFSGGSRICIGQNFAVTEIAYTVVRILQHYVSIEDFNVCGKDEPMIRYGIVATPEQGVMVRFVPK